MPTYEYKCDNCNKNFELVQRITAKPIRKCPSCGAKVRRLFGPGGGIIFKGAGFYATDYRSESYKKEEKKEKDARAPKQSPSPSKATNNSKSRPSS